MTRSEKKYSAGSNQTEPVSFLFSIVKAVVFNKTNTVAVNKKYNINAES